jgi:hypothetical protein
MNDLESRLRTSLRTAGRVEPATMPRGTSARVRARRFVGGAGVCAVLAVFVVGAVWAIPNGDRSPDRTPAEGGDTSVPPGWPEVVVGDPGEAYIGSFEHHGLVGDVHLLTSGTVDGMEFSLVGYTEQAEGLEVCLQMAGPDTGGPMISPGPVAPGERATTGGVGGFCMADRMAQAAVELGWPDFPSNADLFARTWGEDGQYLGFVSYRVALLRVQLADDTTVEIPLLRFPNHQNTAAFTLFPPSLAPGATLEALDDDGALLATATMCPPDDDVDGCSILATDQVVPASG